jgi:predicted nuclease with TOPRIM domain
MADTTDQTSFEEQGPKKGIVIIVISILLGTNALLLWQFFEKKNNLDVANRTIVTTTAEKDALQTQLNEVKTEYEKIKSENGNLQTELAAKDDEIKTKTAEIQRLITVGGPAQIAKAKAELAKLKEMNAVYVSQIDSLNAVNTKLQVENKKLNTNLSSEQSKNQNLSSENSKLAGKVAAGSILKAYNITTEGLKFKSSGKEVITDKAKQIQKIRTKFIIGENHVVDKGSIDIYIRVMGPDGTVMASPEQGNFQSNDQLTLAYTLKLSVEYNNQDKTVEALWAKQTPFTKGKYSIEIYHKGQILGNSSVDLK